MWNSRMSHNWTMWAQYFKTHYQKLQNLLGMKLSTDVNLLFLSVADSHILNFFYVISMNFEIKWINEYYHFSDRFACTINVNIKEMGNCGFVQIPIWQMDCSQRIKDLLLVKWSIFSGKGVSLLLWETLNLFKQGWYCEVWQSIILWYMDLLILSYHLQ